MEIDKLNKTVLCTEEELLLLASLTRKGIRDTIVPWDSERTTYRKKRSIRHTTEDFGVVEFYCFVDGAPVPVVNYVLGTMVEIVVKLPKGSSSELIREVAYEQIDAILNETRDSYIKRVSVWARTDTLYVISDEDFERRKHGSHRVIRQSESQSEGSPENS